VCSREGLPPVHRPVAGTDCRGRPPVADASNRLGAVPKGVDVYRALKFVLMVGIGLMVVRSLPDLARYLKIRSL
jgi:hypothetical protein